jgi:hypothetical protein
MKSHSVCPPTHDLQSGRPALGAHVPLVLLQNWFTGQYVLSRQKLVHVPLLQVFFGAQSPSFRQPGLQAAVTALQI